MNSISVIKLNMGVETSNEKMNYSDNDISDEKINELSPNLGL